MQSVPPLRSQGTPVGPAMAPNQAEVAAPPLGAFAPDQVRLPLLNSQAGPVGTTPRPTPQQVQEHQQFIERTIDPEATLDLVERRPRILIFKQSPIRVQIADPEIANYQLVTETELSVEGLQTGSTILNLWFPLPNGQSRILSYLVRVFPDPEQRERLERVYQALQGEINRSFPDSVVRLSLVGDKVVVAGQARDIVEAAQILRLVAANAPGGGRSDTAEEIPVTQINVNPQPNIFGDQPQQGLENYLLRDIGRRVINLLRVPGDQQVMLRVTVAEVNRTAARSIGLDFSITNNAGVTVFSQATNAVANAAAGGGLGAAANLPTLLDNGQVALAIRALRNLNLARTMAEPNLVTLNGQSAQFSAGGQFPVPAATQAFGGVGQGVAFVPFGVQLQFTPFITDRDRIRLIVGATVSSIDASLGTSVGGNAAAGGTQVNGLQSRTFQSTVELREGQTLAVAGLMQNSFTARSNRVPLWGDLPIIGVTGGRNDTTQGEQELVILITPELVHPLDACNTPNVPGSDVFEPSDIEFFLLNRLESRRMTDFRTSVRTDKHRICAYERCEDRFIIGPKGLSYGCCGPTPCQDCREPQVLPPPPRSVLPPQPEPVPAVEATLQSPLSANPTIAPANVQHIR